MSSSNLVRLGYKKEVSYGVTPAAVAATAVLDLTADITLTSVKKGAGRNTKTFTLQVAPAAANPTDTILAAFTGTESAIVCTITPNDGTNNGSVAVNLTTAQLRELISTGAVVGKTVTITDAHIQIGCQGHPIVKWEKFADRTIAAMDYRALEFWTAYKPTVMTLAATRS